MVDFQASSNFCLRVQRRGVRNIADIKIRSNAKDALLFLLLDLRLGNFDGAAADANIGCGSRQF